MAEPTIEELRQQRARAEEVYPSYYEYYVEYPGHLYLVGPPYRNLFLSYNKSTRETEEELCTKGYKPFRSWSFGALWRHDTPKMILPYPEYVFIYDEEQGDRAGWTAFIRIYGLETLLHFAFAYHLPLVPQTEEEAREFVKYGYDFVAPFLHLYATQYGQPSVRWGENDYPGPQQQLTTAIEIQLEAACESARTHGKNRMQLGPREDY